VNTLGDQLGDEHLGEDDGSLLGAGGGDGRQQPPEHPRPVTRQLGLQWLFRN